MKLAWDSGDSATLTIERLEPRRVVAYTWRIYGLPEDDTRRTHTVSTLAAASTGTTLTMVEIGFAQVPDLGGHTVAYKGNVEGWTSELGELVAYLDGHA